MFYFISAYQDALCGVLLILKGEKAGRYTSMYKTLRKENNPVRIIIVKTITEYIDWFYRWRDKRNKIKKGINLGLVGPSFDVGISFSYVYEKNNALVCDIKDAIRLSDIVQALRMSISLANTAWAISKEIEAR